MKLLNSLLKLNNFDFKVDSKTMGNLKSMLEQLVLSSPSDSFIKVYIQKHNDSKFVSIVKVSSDKLTFVVESICTSPFTAFRKARNLAADNIDFWTKNRFEDAVPVRLKKLIEN